MRALIAATALLLTQNSWADPFTDCPAQAFLTQGSVPATYAVNLVTGDYKVLTRSMGTRKPVNALGFNPEDQYIYGWSREHKVPARVNSDWQIEPLAVTNITNQNFYVGDVTPSGSIYYVYRPGANYGLYSIGLDPAAPDYLQMNRIVDGGTLNLRIFDMAINPTDGMAYALDRTGALHRLDLATGSSEMLAQTNETGTFGAAYFDPDGNFYASRNKDGDIFRFAIDAGDYTPVLFASGPSSNINDGSRCALAPVADLSDTAIDFGDAPDSYGTYLESNGARHGLLSNPDLFFGRRVDGESDAYVFPLSDDDSASEDDEDGIQFATALEEGKKAIAVVRSSGSGFVSAWIDINRNGTFEDDEQVAADAPVSRGRQALYMEIPAGVVAGESWARFRLSSSTGLRANGGASDGEVEDFPVTLVAAQTVTKNYPSGKGWSTIAFEDNWPLEGDYDMNDLVAYLRTSVSSRPTGVTHVEIKGELAAVGAAYHNGFGIRLPGVARDQVDHDNVRLMINGEQVTSRSVIETGRQEAILIVTYNVFDHVGAGNFCLFYRTEQGCGSDIQMDFTASIPMLDPVDVQLKGVFDPFLFATPGAWHGSHFATAPGRSYEIHVKNQAPTEAFDAALIDVPGEDISDAAFGRYFQTERGLPWAIEVGTRWRYPREYRDIGHAYHLFSNFATSGGVDYADWYSDRYASPDVIFVD